eukprot:Platyproteum_vivax@DN2301_c0_g1_i1.p1
MNQQALHYRNLVCEGGGVKGAAFGGCLQVFEEMGILRNITRVAGTSVGAITACLLAVGYQANDVTKIINTTDFSQFEDAPCCVCSILRTYGYYKGDNFEKWMCNLIKRKTGNAKTTFKDLADEIRKGNAKNYRELTVLVTNVTKQKYQIFSAETRPNVPIAHACRMSMSVPLFFRAVQMSGDYFVDGGLAYVYPIDVYDKKNYLMNVRNGQVDPMEQSPDHIFNWETIGFKFWMKKKYDKNHRPIPTPIKDLSQFIGVVVSFTTETANRVHLEDLDVARSIFINTGDIEALDFNISDEQKAWLVEQGRRAVLKYFTTKAQDPVLSLRPV